MQVDPNQIEQLINLKRAARAARRALESPGDLPEWGAVVAFPVAVFAPGSARGRNDHYWSYAVSREPGAVCPPGITAVDYRGTINGLRFTGRFHIVVHSGDGLTDPAPAASVATAGSLPRWAEALPGNIQASAVDRPTLLRNLVRAARREAEATDQLLASAYPFLEHIADGFAAQLRHRRSSLDREDIINEGWKRVYQLLDVFSSPERPAVPWSTALYRNCRRDMSRAVHALDGMSEAVATVRAVCNTHPEITDPAAMQRLLAGQAQERRLAAGGPGRHGRPEAEADLSPGVEKPCPFSLQQISWAMAAPQVVSWHDAASRHDDAGGEADEAVLADRLAGVEDCGLSAVTSAVAATARSLTEASGTDHRSMLDVMADLGVSAAGDPAAARLPHLRRRLLSPFILAGEKPHSEAVLRRAGHRARAKLFADGELLTGRPLAEAWRAGISAEEARELDAQLAGT